MKTLVIIVTIIGLSAVVGSIIVGRMVFEGKVVDKPYETGLRYDEIEKARTLFVFEILNKEFHRGDNDIIFTIKDTSGKVVTDTNVIFALSRPSTTVYDREYNVNLVGSRYMAKVNIPLKGYWDVRIRFTMEGKPVVLEKRVYVMP